MIIVTSSVHTHHNHYYRCGHCSWFYFTWPLRKQAACKQARDQQFKSFPRDEALRIKCLAQRHYYKLKGLGFEPGTTSICGLKVCFHRNVNDSQRISFVFQAPKVCQTCAGGCQLFTGVRHLFAGVIFSSVGILTKFEISCKHFQHPANNNDNASEPPRIFGKLLEAKIRMLDFAIFFDIRILRVSFVCPVKTLLYPLDHNSSSVIIITIPILLITNKT